MNKQKLISALQSRISKRKVQINYEWFIYLCEGYGHHYDEYDRVGAKEFAIKLGKEQKVDKALLKLVQSSFDAGFAVGYQEACKAVKHTLEACECQQ
jgi:hypothetical protein